MGALLSAFPLLPKSDHEIRSFCLHGTTTRIPLAGFSVNFVRGFFENVSRKFYFD
jgi:hypothetical protein